MRPPTSFRPTCVGKLYALCAWSGCAMSMATGVGGSPLSIGSGDVCHAQLRARCALLDKLPRGVRANCILFVPAGASEVNSAVAILCEISNMCSFYTAAVAFMRCFAGHRSTWCRLHSQRRLVAENRGEHRIAELACHFHGWLQRCVDRVTGRKWTSRSCA